MPVLGQMPYRTRLVDKNGYLTHAGHIYLKDQHKVIDEYGKKVTVENHDEDFTLILPEMRKLHMANCSLSEINAYLPSVDSTNVGDWVRIGRNGSFPLLIHAADEDSILDTETSGGYLQCSTVDYICQQITLVLAEENVWWFDTGCFGEWLIKTGW